MLMLRIGVPATSAVLWAGPAFAGTTGTEFEALYNMVNGWATGYLGRTIAVGGLIIGGLVGWAKSSGMPALMGIGWAVIFGVGPAIITNIMSATI
jgi:conjugal transfer pilus assembly protein TraA